MKLIPSTRFQVCFMLGLAFGGGMILEAIRIPQISQAAENSPAFQIVHQPPDSRTLPPPAFMIPLKLEVRNTKLTDLNIRVVASRDGKVMDVSMPQGMLNASDVPVYELQVPAPTQVLSYQFVIHDKTGNVSSTKRYVVRRPCVQNYKVEVPANAADAEFKQAVGELISKAKLLETTTANYETSLKLIEQLKVLVSRNE